MGMSDLEDLIAKQKEEVSVVPTGTADVLLGGELVTLELIKLPPSEWLDLKAAHPPRPSTADLQAGFNGASLLRGYPSDYRRRVVGEERLPISDELWAELMVVLPAVHQDTLSAVAWYLNVHADREAVAAARKALTAASSKKRSSRGS